MKTRLFVWLVLTIGALLLGEACGPTPVPNAISFTVQRLDARVFTGAAQPLPEITNNSPASLPDGHLVATDATGQALLEASVSGGTCRIFLFQDSGLAKRGCARSSFQGGNTSCIEEGSAAFNTCSGHLIMTPSGQAQVSGSWLAAIYLPDRQVTLFILLEGAATVWPVTNYEKRELGAPQKLAPQQFWYSAPDAAQHPLTGLAPRAVWPLEQMPALTQELGAQLWVDGIRQRAKVDAVPFTEARAPVAAPVLTLSGGGDALSKQPAIDAIAQGVDWASMRKQFFAGQDVNVELQTPAGRTDIGGATYNPSAAHELVLKAGYRAGFGLTLLYVAESANDQPIANWLAHGMGDIGVRVTVEQVGGADAQQRLKSLLAAGQTALLLQRQ
jgi:hypothetical protein